MIQFWFFVIDSEGNPVSFLKQEETDCESLNQQQVSHGKYNQILLKSQYKGLQIPHHYQLHFSIYLSSRGEKVMDYSLF